jgi:hypothetical protein
MLAPASSNFVTFNVLPSQLAAQAVEAAEKALAERRAQDAAAVIAAAATQLPDSRVRSMEFLFERENPLHSGQRHAVVGQLLDTSQERDIALGVPAAAASRARGRD